MPKTQYLGEEFLKLEHWQNVETNRSHYLVGLAYDCFIHPDNDRNLHYFARECYWKNRNRTSIELFKRHMAMPNAWAPEQAQSIIYIGDAHLALGEVEEGLQWYHKSYDKDGTRREALLRLAKYYWRIGDHQHAAAYAAASLTVPWTNFYANDASEYRDLPHSILYWALYWMGDREGSRYHWQKALAYQPKNPKYLSDAQFYTDTRKPLVSIIIPTLGRKEKLAECLRLLKQNAEYDNYEVIVKHDYFPPNNIGVPKLVKQAVEESKGELVMYLGNDCLPQPGFLREAVAVMLEKFPNLDGLVSLNDQYWHGELSTHWLAGKNLLPLLDGEFFHTGYYHLGCDDELTARCKAANKYVWAEKAVVLHDHPLNASKKQMTYDEIAKTDKVYGLAYDAKRRKKDQELLAKRKTQGFK